MNRARLFFPVLLVALCLLIASWAGCGEFESETEKGESTDSQNSLGRLVNHSDLNGLSVSYALADPILIEEEIEGGVFTKVQFEEQALDGGEGAPAIPYFNLSFVVPQGAAVEISARFGQLHTIAEDVLLYPMQPPAQDTTGVPDPAFAFDEKAYMAKGTLPEKTYFLEEEAIIRGLRVRNLWFSPVVYTPNSGRLEIYDSVDLDIRFVGGSEHFLSRPALSSNWAARALGKFAVNGNLIENPTPTKSTEVAPFVILTHPLFFEAAEKLKSWKTRCGIPTEIVSVEDLEMSADKILDFVTERYFEKSTPIEYLLILGDAEFIPTIYRRFHIAHFTRMGSDHYYSCVDGTDDLSDIGVGRIPVDTPEQAMDRIEKIIGYEQAIVEDPSYYNTTHQFAYFQDTDNNNKADRRFLLTSEEIFRWFNEVNQSEGPTPHRCYVTGEDVVPQMWSTSRDYAFFADWWTHSRTYLPDELLRGNGFAWDCDAAQINKAVNDGAAFITHRDHGSSLGWGDPAYYSYNVDILQNGEKLPVVWTVNCQTGWFDNETDSMIDLSAQNQISFTESWLRNLNGGAAGLLAATRISYSGYNDRLVWGWMDAVWPGYIPTFGGSPTKVDETAALSVADVVAYGKYYLSTVYFPTSTRHIATEEFQWFGDPTMKMWTTVPKDFEIEHNPGVRPESTSFLIMTGTDNALVVITEGEKVLGSARTVDGGALVELSGLPGLGDNIEITVTADGYRPYLAKVKVATCIEDNDCSDDVFCNGEELCINGSCEQGAPADCDDGLWCTGEESCDTDLDACVSTGNPCADDLVCNEELEACSNTDSSDDSEVGSVCGF